MQCQVKYNHQQHKWCPEYHELIMDFRIIARVSLFTGDDTQRNSYHWISHKVAKLEEDMDPRFNIIASLSTKVKKRELQGETNKAQKLYLLIWRRTTRTKLK